MTVTATTKLKPPNAKTAAKRIMAAAAALGQCYPDASPLAVSECLEYAIRAARVVKMRAQYAGLAGPWQQKMWNADEEDAAEHLAFRLRSRVLGADSEFPLKVLAPCAFDLDRGDLIVRLLGQQARRYPLI